MLTRELWEALTPELDDTAVKPPATPRLWSQVFRPGGQGSRNWKYGL